MPNTRKTLRPQISVVQAMNMPQVRRTHRRPQHKFNLKYKPFEIVPFMCAPVLPGETMENLLMQVRAVTDPIQNALIGWHHETYFFYVKHRALSAWDTGSALQNMMLDPTTSVAALKAAANSTPYYTFKTAMDYVKACTECVVTEYFRDEGEAVNVASIENYYAAQIDQESWYQSIKLESATGDDNELPGVDEQEELDILPGFTSQYAQWEIMRDNGLTDLTYEDYLRSYGVSIPKSEDEGQSPDERHKPELIRFVREWTYPSNTVEPTNGSVASACSWSIAERADKKRFFKEPGFILGLRVVRPKIYLGNQKGSAVGMLDTPYAWLPAVLSEHPYTSVKENLFSATDGILQNQTQDYWVDLKDLYLYGDQFVNHTLAAAANHGIALPSATLDRKYPTNTMVNGLFKTAGSEYVREDGVVHLNILSRVRETTP